MKTILCWVIFAFLLEGNCLVAHSLHQDLLAQCSLDGCFYNYIQDKLPGFLPYAVENGFEPFHVPGEIIKSVPTILSNLTFSYRNVTVSGLVNSLDLTFLNSTKLEADIFHGFVFVGLRFTRGFRVIVSGTYSAHGTVDNVDIDTQGAFSSRLSEPVYTEDFYDYINPVLLSRTYFVVDEEGLVNVTSQASEIRPSYIQDKEDYVENMLNSSHPFLPFIVESQAQKLIPGLTKDLHPFCPLFEGFLKSLLQGVSIFDLDEWGNNTLLFSPSEELRHSVSKQESLPTNFACHPRDCFYQFLELQGKLLKENGIDGSTDEFLNLPICNQTVTPLFDFETCFTDIVLKDFYSSSEVGGLELDIVNGTLSFYFLTNLDLSGSIVANGTLYGEEFQKQGSWAADFSQQFWVLTSSFAINDEGFLTFENYSSYAYLADNEHVKPWTDLFPQDIEVNYMFGKEIFAQLNPSFLALVNDNIMAGIMAYFQARLSEIPFSDIVAGAASNGLEKRDLLHSKSKQDMNAKEPKADCSDPDTCFIDYLIQKLRRYYVWIAERWQDPILFEHNITVPFQENTWGLTLTLGNVANSGFIPRLFSDIYRISSQTYDGTLTIEDFSRPVRFNGTYLANGSMAGHTLKSTGSWTKSVYVQTTIKLTYSVGTDGYIDSVAQDSITSSYKCYDNACYLNADILNSSLPLQERFYHALNTNIDTVFGPELSDYVGIVKEFFKEILSEDTFYNIITGRRYVTDITTTSTTTPATTTTTSTTTTPSTTTTTTTPTTQAIITTEVPVVSSSTTKQPRTEPTTTTTKTTELAEATTKADATTNVESTSPTDKVTVETTTTTNGALTRAGNCFFVSSVITWLWLLTFPVISVF